MARAKTHAKTHAKSPAKSLSKTSVSSPSPVDSIDGEVAKISARIRRWREDAGLTLQQLAKRSGLATSTIQKVETGQMIPSVAVLLKVSHGLGRRPTELIHEGETRLELAVVRAGDHDRKGTRSVRTERLSGDLSDPELEMWRVRLSPGASSGDSTIHYAGEELVLCERGEVTFTVGGEDFVLAPGDTLHFKARSPHAFRNEGSEEASFTVTGTLPAKFRALIGSRVARAS